MRKLILAILLLCPAAHATYYFANAGNDANACTQAAPCQTVSKANSLASSSAYTVFLFHGGDTFRDAYLQCGTTYQNTGNATTATNPPACRGNSFGSYGTGQAIFDAADPICNNGWTLVKGRTYACSLASGSAVPQKLYVDPAFTVFSLSAQGGAATGSSMLQEQLLPVPNFVGAGCSGTANFLDAYGPYYNANGEGYLLMNMQPQQAACSTLTATQPVDAQTAMQGFNTDTAGGTGLANVENGTASFAPQLPGFGYPTYPGVWYVSGNCPTQACTIYLNLASGANPNAHVIEATHRPYGVLIEGTNNVTVENVIIAHAEQSCVLVLPYSTVDFLANGITVENNTVFNCASNWQDPIAQSDIGPGGVTISNAPLNNENNLNGGIVFEPSGGDNPLLMAFPQVLNNRVGTINTYHGTETGSGTFAGIYIQAADGGGARNACVICGNIVSTSHAPAIVYATGRVALTLPTSIEQNKGGRVSSNNVTNSQSNINFTGVAGGLLDSNYVYESYGQGIQLGGSSTSVDGGKSGPVAGSQVIEFNRIANIGLDASFGFYNGFDCNDSRTAFGGMYYIGNTIYNVFAAGMTFEQTNVNGVQNPNVGCINPHVWGNILDLNAPTYGNGSAKSTSWTQATSPQNGSNSFYINSDLPPSTYDMESNWYNLSSIQGYFTGYPGCPTSGSATGNGCSFLQWLSVYDPTDNSTYNGTVPPFLAPLPGSDNVTLPSNAPQIGAGKSGVNNGNIGVYVTNPIPGNKSALFTGSTQ